MTSRIPTVILLSVLCLTACKTVQTATDTTQNHTATDTRRDSIYLHDSISVEYRRGSPLHLLNLRTDNNVANEDNSSHSFNSLTKPIRVDTVYLEKWHTKWREREVTRTDTVQMESIRVETKEVRYIPRFYKYCTAFAIILFLIILLRVTLYLYRRFH